MGNIARAWLWESVLILFLLLFLLLEGRMLTRRIVEVFGPQAEPQDKAVAALEDMANQIRTYLVWRTIINFGMAVILGLIYYIIGLGQAWTWALFTAILLYVPYLGTIMAGAAGAGRLPDVRFAVGGDGRAGVLRGVRDDRGLFHRAGGDGAEHGAERHDGDAVVPVLGTGVGPAGLFLAMPLMAAAKTVCTHVPEWQAWANLMDTRTEPDEPFAAASSPDALLETQIIPASDLNRARTEKVEERRAT